MRLGLTRSARVARNDRKESQMRRGFLLAAALAAAAAFAVVGSGPATADVTLAPRVFKMSGAPGPEISGAVEFRDVEFGTGLTECPQAGSSAQPKPLDHRTADQAEQVSSAGNDRRANDPEYSCFPQNETSIDVNPRDLSNAVGGANDYRLGWATSGYYATTDNGNHWYTGLIPFPTLPNGDNLDGGGDPAIVYDSAGVVYYADINFNRTDDTNGVFVSRSTNGGFTWSRPCVVLTDTSPCGGTGDPRQPGDGTVAFTPENQTTPPFGSSANFSVTFNDKEFIAAGPRPAGVDPHCFKPVSKAVLNPGDVGCSAANIGPERIYVTWTRFTNPTGAPGFITDSKIVMSYSDDMGRSWSPAAGHQRRRALLHGLVRRRNRVRRQPVLGADGESPHGTSVRRVRELRHAGREPGARRALDRRRRQFRRAVLRDADVRRQSAPPG